MKDSELFGRVRDDYDLQTKIHAEATKSRFNDMTVTHTWPRFSAAHQKHPAWNPAKAGEYFRQYMKASASVSDIADETRKIANDLTGILRTFNSDSDLTPAVEMIRGLDEREMRAVVMQMEWNASNVEGSANQAGEAAYRGVRDFFNRIPRSLQRQQWNDLAPIKEGDEVSVNAVDAEAILKSAVDNKHGEAMARIIASSYEPSFIVSQHLPQYSAATRKLTAQEAQEAEALRQQKLNDLHTLDQLTEFAEQTLDPIKAENAFMEYFALPVIQSAPVSLVSLIPGAGLAVNTLYYEDVAYNRMRREGASHEEASRYALTVGVLQSAAETVKVGALLGKLPLTRSIVSRLIQPAHGMARRYATHLAVGVGGGTLTEQFQDQIIPALVQDVTKIGGDVSWLGREGVLMETVRTAPRAAAAVLLIGMGGSAVATAKDLQQRQHLFDSQDHLMASGLSEAQAVEVLGGVTFDDKINALQKVWPERQGNKESIQAAAQRVEAGMTRDATAMRHLEEHGVMPRVRKTDEGWEVQASGDSDASTFSDPADAEQLRSDAVDHYERKGLEKVRESFQRPAAAQTTTSANANPDATPSPTDVTHSTANNSLSDAVATDSASAPASSAHAATASTSSPARSEADADVTLKADLAHAVAMNAVTAPDVMTREMIAHGHASGQRRGGL